MKVSEILRKIKIDYRRVIAGVVFLVLELCLMFGSGALLEDEVHMHTGEGSWDIAFTDEAPFVSQEFVPAHKKLRSLSFRMDLAGLTQWDNEVTVVIEDKTGNVLFERVMSIQEITDGAYTDVDVNLELSTRESYYWKIAVTPTSAEEYPVISLCSTDYKLPESRSFVHGEKLEGAHLVSRYQYTDGLPASRAMKAVILCLVAAFGIVVGLPKNNYVRKAIGVVILLAAPYVLGQRLELLTHDVAFYLPHAMKWNLGIMYALELVVLLVTHSTAVSIVLTNVFLTVLYSANYFVLMHRGTSLNMNDITAIGTATDVMGEYNLTPNSHLAFAWAMALILVVYGAQTCKVRKAKRIEAAAEGAAEGTNASSEVSGEGKTANGGKRRFAFVALSYVVTIAMAVGIVWYGGYKLLYTDYLYENGFADKEFVGYTHQLLYSFNGYLVGTCVEVKNSRIEKPEGYSAEQVEALLTAANAESESAEEKPHIIIVMNESLADVRTVADVELNQENMPFLKSMQENTVKGTVNVSTYGGGTANSEFELFTGCSMAFLPVNYYPYQQALRAPVDSMISQLKAQGYTTVSMHPERAGNWNRENVYKHYGFDTMLFQPDFADAEIVHSGVSDAETYKRIIELYENRREGEKLFLFDLTMQNHGGYEQNDGPDEVQAVNVNEPQLDEYLSVVKVSDEAFADLVSYFETQDEKVVICLFGDHQPSVFDLVAGQTVGTEASESAMNKYRTPFVIWANYDIEEAEGYDISLNYLGGLVMRTAGVQMSPYFAYLEQLREEYPIITINGYVDDRGNYANWSGELNEFPEYRMLQYNYLFADDTVEWGY